MKVRLLLFLLFIGSHFLSAQNLDSVLQSLTQLSDSNKVDSLIKISRSYVVKAEGKKALPYAKWAYKKALEKDFVDLIPKSHFYLASAYMEGQEPDSALIHYEESLEEMPGTAHEDWAIHVFINVPWLYQNAGNYQKALESQLSALEYAEKKNDTFMMAECLTEIGYSHDRMRAFDEAIKWHRKALPLLKQLNKMGFYHYVLSRIGMAYDDLAVYDSAFHYNFKALAFFEENQDSSEIADISSNIGNSYYKLGEWEKARDYTLKSYYFKKKSQLKSFLAITTSNLGFIYTKLKEFDKAEKYLREAIQFANTTGHKKSLSEAYEGLYNLYQDKENLDSAIYYFKLMDQLEDSIYQLDRTEQMAEMQTRYETEKKEQQIALQQSELQQKESKLLAKQRLIFVLILLVVIVLIFAYLFYQRYKAKKEQEMQQAVIKEQQKGINAVFEAQEEERKRISKDLHDGIGQQLSGLKMAFQKLSGELKTTNPEKQKELEQLSNVLQDSADEVRSISHQMMPRSLTELGIIEAIDDMLEKSLGHTNINYEFEHFGIEGRLAERIEVSIYRICQELINNIIKHSEAQQVQVQLFKNKGKVILIVEDNGKGINEKVSTEGHGLLNIKSRLNSINGEVNYEPSPNSGTIATIRIPLK